MANFAVDLITYAKSAQHPQRQMYQKFVKGTGGGWTKKRADTNIKHKRVTRI
jgi:uncharacterized protein YijF (DUF1287 family)